MNSHRGVPKNRKDIDMNRMPPAFGRAAQAASLLLITLMVTACGLPIKPQPVQNTYRINPLNTLDSPAIVGSQGGRTFLIQLRPIEADTGFDSSAMMYSRHAQELRPYRDNRWLAPPAEMLTDAIGQTLVRQPWVQGVVPNASVAPVAVSLRCHLNRLEHDMSGAQGRVRLALDCLWVDPRSHSVRSHWYFNEAQPLTRDDAAHFAQASQDLVNRAVGIIIQKTRQLLAEPPARATNTEDAS